MGKQKEETKTQKPLEQFELYNVLNIGEEIYNAAYNSKYDGFGMKTPYTTNSILSEIGFNPKNIDSDKLSKALSIPTEIDSQKTLVGYSEWLQLTDSVAKRTLGYMGNLPSFDYTFYCNNIKNEKDFLSDEYKRDIKKVKEFLTKFNPKTQFSYVNRRTLATDAYFGVFRTDGNNYKFQEIPPERCLITGKDFDYGYMFDLDMDWFVSRGVSIDYYPPSFRKLWNKVFDNSGNPVYDPNKKPKNRNGVFSTWVSTSPDLNKGGFVCFKYNSDMYAKIPFLTCLFGDAANKPLVRELQNNQYIIASQKLIIGLVPFLNNAKSAQVKDALALDSATLGRFLGLLKKGIHESIKVGGVPFSDVKDINFELPDKNMYDEYSKTYASNSGVTSRFVYTSDKMSASEAKYNMEIDSFISTAIYPQYSEWLTTIVNGLTKKYKFTFKFEGTNYSDNKKERLDRAYKNADNGMVDFQAIASANGQGYFEFEARILQSKNSDIWSALKLLPNTNTKSDGDSNGRPKTDNPSDSTERSDDYVY